MRWVALFTVLLAAGLAFAENAASDPMAAEMARETYQIGAEHFRQQRWAEAERAFREVYNMLRLAEVQHDIALSLEKQRKWGAAAEALEIYLRDSGKVTDRKKIQERIADLKGRAQRQHDLDAAQGVSAAKPSAEEKLRSTELVVSNPATAALPAGESSRRQVAPATPIYRQWWLWVGLGLVLGGGGVALGAVLANQGGGGGTQTTLPDFGPGSKALVAF